MARKPRDHDGDEDGDGGGTNTMTDADRLQIIEQAKELERQRDQINGKMSRVWQRARNLGASTAQVNGIKRAMRAKTQDENDLIEEEREFARTAALLRLPTEQMGLTLGDLHIDPKLDHQVAVTDAFDTGYAAGEAGRAIDTNPWHQAEGSELFVEWRKGWDAGQAAIAWRMGGGAPAQPSAARRPGRPKKTEETTTDGEGPETKH
jgi:uncharacterized protein (UPF0335 family)/ribosome modulation factor